MASPRRPNPTLSHHPSPALAQQPYSNAQFLPAEDPDPFPSQVSEAAASPKSCDAVVYAPTAPGTPLATASCQSPFGTTYITRSLPLIHEPYTACSAESNGLNGSGYRGPPECAYDDLGASFDAIRLSDVQSTVDSLAYPLVTKLATRGLTYPEKNVVSAIFDEDLIDWGSDSDEPEQDLPSAHEPGQPLDNKALSPIEDKPHAIAWNDLTWGIKWIILNTLDTNQRFAKTVSITLRLTRHQVREFIALYIKEYQRWQVYEDRVQKIPWNDLRLHAHESNKTVVDIIHEYRPRLSTDCLPHQAIQMGCLFLRNNRLEKYVRDLESWTGVGAVDFLVLNIEGDILQECVDYSMVKNAVEAGKLNLDSFPRDEAPKQNPAFARPDDPFLGILKDTLSETETPPRALSESLEKITHEETTTWHRQPSSKTHRSAAPISARLFIKGAQSRQDRELNNAICRQYPDCFRYVNGRLVSTLIEEDRPAKPLRRATEHRPPPAISDQRAVQKPAVAPVQVKLARATCRKDPVVKRGKAQAVRATKPPDVEIQPAAKQANPSDKPTQPQNKGRPAALTAHLPPPTQESISTLASSIARVSENLDRHLGPMIESSFSAGYKAIKSSFNTPNNIFSQQNGRPRAGSGPYRQAARPVPSDELRDLLNINFAAHAKQPVKEDQVHNERSSSTESDDGHDHEAEDLVVREAENDSDYQPKGSRKRKAPKKATVGSGRKNGHLGSHPEQQSTPAKGRRGKKDENEHPVQFISPRVSQQPVPRKRAKPSSPTRIESSDSSQRSVESGRPLSTDTGHEVQVPSTPTLKSERIFGMLRTTLLSSSMGRTDKVFYAWSADQATYAAISRTAHFAETADRIVPPSEGAPTSKPDPAGNFQALKSLKEEFAKVEDVQKASVAQNAREARFAGCADAAVYAGHADVAFFALSPIGGAEPAEPESCDGEEASAIVEEPKGGVEVEDTPMPDISDEV
ncbi:hypothetical protein AK830_g10039 [Neonectria ditissima]|uniref:Uncharacterized protein n=1 Tax=Neonectria ditissima TaxID=78410 RepID=A0A0N8H5L8_9HYPO|nr:hypothetical protein AK830_g10039 [Neonectria ditissima]